MTLASSIRATLRGIWTNSSCQSRSSRSVIGLQKISNVDAPEYLILCNECGEENEIVIDMDNFKMTVIEEHTNIITINDELRISMKYPTASMILTEQKNNQIDFFDIAALCIDKVEYGGEIISDATLEEKEEFIDNLIVILFFDRW